MWLYAVVPLVLAAVGTLYALTWPPSGKVAGAIQHFAAGVILYAGAAELLPDAARRGSVWAIVVGGGIGIAAMLGLRAVAERVRGPTGLVGASAVDAVIDGLVLGLGFAVGRHQGMMLTIALGVEYLFLGLSLTTAFPSGASRWNVAGAVAAVSLMVPLGVLLSRGVDLLPRLYAAACFAFGLVALLYLVIEELLVEAHDKPETALGRRSFMSASSP